MSLSRSFILGGTHAIVHTLWLLDDRSASKIITDFYQGLFKGRAKSIALHEAKLNYLENSSPSFSHPYFWAGYQLVGNVSPIFYNHIRIALIIVSSLILGAVALGVQRKYRAIH